MKSLKQIILKVSKIILTLSATTMLINPVSTQTTTSASIKLTHTYTSHMIIKSVTTKTTNNITHIYYTCTDSQGNVWSILTDESKEDIKANKPIGKSIIVMLNDNGTITNHDDILLFWDYETKVINN